MTNATSAIVNNGVNVDALLGAREALEKAPEAAQFKWRASCEWLNGTHSRSAIGSFFGLGAEQSRSKTFTVEADHPQVFAAEDNAPTPVELVLSGPCELPHGGRCRCCPAARHPAPFGQGIARSRHGSSGHSRHRRRRAQWLRRHPRSFRHSRRCERGRHQGAGRPIAEAVGRIRHRHQPDERLRHRQLTAAAGSRSECREVRDRPSSSAPANPDWP